MSENLSILVVDDYPPIANTLADILDRKGFEVKTANSGAEALEILRDHPMDILLTDAMMPEMNGIELYREARKILPTLTTILITDDDAGDLVQQGFKEGIKAILDKPVDINFLFRLLSAIKEGKSNAD